MDNITKIQEDMRIGLFNSNPHEAAEARALLSGEFSFICGQLEDILKRKSAVWSELRKSVKSDTACDRAYEMTADGLNELGLRLRMKSCEKMMQGLGSLIKIAEGESHNLH